MNKYSLCYIKNNEIKLIGDLDSLQSIDNYTTKFDSERELIADIKLNNGISDNIYKVYVYNKSKKKIIYDGDILLFSDSKDKISIDYVNKMFREYKANPKKLLILSKMYAKKYKNKDGFLPKVNGLYTYAVSKIDNTYDISGYDEREYLSSLVTSFINAEFYSKLKYNEIKTKYSAIREFVIKTMYINGIINENRPLSFLNIDDKNEFKRKETVEVLFDEEEFLTEEDIIRSCKEILKGYEFDTSDGVVDGHDYIKPITESELKRTLYESGKKLIKRPKEDSK